MIVERESLMSDADFKNKKWFPNYIVLRRVVNTYQQNEWETVIHTINTSQEKAIANLKTEIKTEIKDEIKDIKAILLRIQENELRQ